MHYLHIYEHFPELSSLENEYNTNSYVIFIERGQNSKYKYLHLYICSGIPRFADFII